MLEKLNARLSHPDRARKIDTAWDDTRSVAVSGHGVSLGAVVGEAGGT